MGLSPPWSAAIAGTWWCVREPSHFLGLPRVYRRYRYDALRVSAKDPSFSNQTRLRHREQHGEVGVLQWLEDDHWSVHEAYHQFAERAVQALCVFLWLSSGWNGALGTFGVQW